VIFDYQSKQLLLRPSQQFKKPFNYNMSGLDVGTPLPGLPLYVIAGVTTHSPAHEAGLQQNDQIMTIDGTNVSQYTLNDILELFQSKPGKKIKLTVMRNATTVKAVIILKRPI
jgi:C-terminal processing protease CtpA/Prc